MATARKQPSGNWKILVYAGMVNGKRKYQSFTAPTKREAEYKAAQYLHSVGKATQEDMTVGEAVDRYIESKSAVLSPSTIREYRAEQRNHLAGISQLKLSRLTQEHVQRLINDIAQAHSPKTCKNVHGLLYAAVAAYRPELVLRTRLPQAARKMAYVPSKSEVLALMDKAKGTDMELPVLLAAMMGLRRSEVCGLTWDAIDLKRKQLTIKQAVVLNADNEYTTKGPKSTAGYRVLDIPDAVLDKLKKMDKRRPLVDFSPLALTHRFTKLRAAVGLPDGFRYHDLRHYYASVMLALGVPDKYAMEQMGHATNAMLKTIYQHTLEEKKREITTQISSYFSNMQTEMQTDKKKSP